MSKELPWFKFSPDAWLVGSISFLDLETQGLFILICSHYWREKRVLTVEKIQKRLRVKNETLLRCLEELKKEKIIKITKDRIKIKFLDEQHKELTAKKKKLSEAGKRGAKAKAKLKPPLSHPEAKLKRGLSNKDKEVDKIRKEGEGEEDACSENPEQLEQRIALPHFKILCHVGDGEDQAFELLANKYTKDFLMTAINARRASRKNNGEKPRPCLSDLSEWINAHGTKYPDRHHRKESA